MKKLTKINEPDIKTLFEINDAIAQTHSKTELFNTIFRKLEPVFDFAFAAIMLYDKTGSYIEVLSGSIYGATTKRIRMSVSEIPFSLSTKKITIIKLSEISKLPGDLSYDPEGPEAKETTLCPLNSAGKVIGFLTFAHREEGCMTEKRRELLKTISNPIATAVSNITAYEELLQRDMEKELQLKFVNSLVGIKDRAQMFYKLASEIQKIDRFQYMGVILNHKENERSSSHLFTMGSKGILKSVAPVPNYDFEIISSYGSAANSSKMLEFSPDEIESLLRRSLFFRELNQKTPIKSIHYAPGPIEGFNMMVMLINSVHGYEPVQSGHLSQVGPQIELALRNLLAFEENELFRKQLEHEKHALLDEIKIPGSFQGMIGSSAGIKKVLKQIKQVAKTDTTILVQGETGVGKELVAKALHDNSHRKDKVFITVNCASLPAQLIESELFGHEKGSFTGAIERRIGKFELANGGTIFLDEIGELPLELQAKLLRVLQEKEFERIGGKELLHSDIRIIAATNRNLQKEVAEGRFRSDLYFRLNVFPIVVPSLRERAEDIPLFLQYFTERHSKKVGAPLRSVSDKDMNLLLQYNWPGNIRELEHVVERAVITSTGLFLEFSGFIGPLRNTEITSPEDFKALADLEKEHILNALKLANGRISGDKGAAKLLGLNSKTLDSKIKKLGVKKTILLT
jgi:transcriptional regulator with GAF, ATPase, and Fis domain